MTMKQDELECYAVETDDSRFYVVISPGYPFFTACNATRFNSREELEINLQLRFPECRLSKDIEFTCLDAKCYKIMGILQSDMQEAVQTGKGLL